MGARRINGRGAGIGFGAGCGFGIGWGFGGGSLGFAGLGVGGGCGIGAGLGWGIGWGWGTQYIDVSPEFKEGKQHRPNPIQQVKYVFKRLTTLQPPPPSHLPSGK